MESRLVITLQEAENIIEITDYLEKRGKLGDRFLVIYYENNQWTLVYDPLDVRSNWVIPILNKIRINNLEISRQCPHNDITKGNVKICLKCGDYIKV